MSSVSSLSSYDSLKIDKILNDNELMIKDLENDDDLEDSLDENEKNKMREIEETHKRID